MGDNKKVIPPPPPEDNGTVVTQKRVVPPPPPEETEVEKKNLIGNKEPINSPSISSLEGGSSGSTASLSGSTAFADKNVTPEPAISSVKTPAPQPQKNETDPGAQHFQQVANHDILPSKDYKDVVSGMGMRTVKAFNSSPIFDKQENRNQYYLSLSKTGKYTPDELQKIKIIGDNAKTIKELGDKVNVNPNDADSHTHLGNIWTEAGDYSRAIQNYSASVAANPQDYRSIYGLGNAYYKMGDLNSAEDYFKEAVHVNPGVNIGPDGSIKLTGDGDPRVYKALASIAHTKGDKESQVKYQNLAQAVSGSQVDTLNKMAEADARGNKFVNGQEMVPHQYTNAGNVQETYITPEEQEYNEKTKAVADMAHDLASGNIPGEAAFLNPYGYIAHTTLSALSEIKDVPEVWMKSMAKDPGNYENATAEAGAKALLAIGHAGMAASAAVSPVMAVFTFLVPPLAKTVPGVEAVEHTVMAPLSTAIEYTKEHEKEVLNAVSGGNPVMAAGVKKILDTLGFDDKKPMSEKLKAATEIVDLLASAMILHKGPKLASKALEKIKDQIVPTQAEMTELFTGLNDLKPEDIEQARKNLNPPIDKKEIFKTVQSAKEIPTAIEQAKADIHAKVAAGEISEFHAEEKAKAIDRAVELDKLIPKQIEGEKRESAHALIDERNELEQAIEGKDRSLTKPETERIKHIEAELESISTGKPVEEILGTEKKGESAKVKEKSKPKAKEPKKNEEPAPVEENKIDEPDIEILRLEKEEGVISEADAKILEELEAKEAAPETKKNAAIAPKTEVAEKENIENLEPEVVSETPKEEPVVEKTLETEPVSTGVATEEKGPLTEQRATEESASEEAKTEEPTIEEPVKKEPAKPAIDIERELSIMKDFRTNNKTEALLKKGKAVIDKIKAQVKEGNIDEELAEDHMARVTDVMTQESMRDSAKQRQMLKDSAEAMIRYYGEATKDLLSANADLDITANGVTIDKLIETAVKIAHKAIDTGMDAKEAVEKAVEKIKGLTAYKDLVKSGLDETELNKKLDDIFLKEKPAEPEPPKSLAPEEKNYNKGSEREKAVINKIHKSDNASPELKKKLEEKGLTYSVFTNKEAQSISKAIIDANGIEAAIETAGNKDAKINGAVKTMIYAEAINHYHKMEMEAKTPAEKEMYSQKQADVESILDESSRDAGRSIQALRGFYKMSPLGIKKAAINKLRRMAESKMENMEDANERISAVEKELSELREKYEKLYTESQTKKNTGKKENIFTSQEVRNQRKNELKERWKQASKGSASSSILGLNKDQIEILGEQGLIHLIEGAYSFKRWAQKMMKDFDGLTEEQAKHIWEKEKVKDENGKEITMAERAKDPAYLKSKEYKEEQQKILNKHFPRKAKELGLKKQKDHEKIIDAYNAGVFEGGVNKDGVSFKELFYKKLGIVDPNDAAIQSKLGDFAEQIAKAPDGSSMQNIEYQKMLNYIADQKKASLIDMGVSVWYANILSSYETHLRNIQYNSTTVALTQAGLLAQKAIMNGKPGDAVKIFKTILGGFDRSAAEFGRVVKKGEASSFESPSEQGPLDRSKSPIAKIFKYPGRFLRGEDVFFTNPLYEGKQKELIIQETRKKFPSKTEKEIEAEVNELMGNTSERAVSAEKQAREEMETFYGSGWEANKDAARNFKIRKYEIIEKSRPEAIRERALDWSKRALLTNKPAGTWGAVADGLKAISDGIVMTKFVIPFINVPLNLADRIIERTPLGFINVIRGKEGYTGKYLRELTKDEKSELAIKATNYTLGSMALVALTAGNDDDNDGLVITGKQTGNYSDNQSEVRGGGLKEYSIYFNGAHIFSYKYTPLAPLFIPAGYMRDYKKFGANKGISDGIATSTVNYLAFVSDQAAMKGLNDFLSFLNPDYKGGKNEGVMSKTIERMKISTAKWAQSVVVPNLIKAANNDVRGLMQRQDTKPNEWYEHFVKDVPWLDEMLTKKTDHLGRPITDVFEVPLVPDAFTIQQTNDPYYKMFKEKEYYPSFSYDRTVFVNNKEVDMSNTELDKLNKTRGAIALRKISAKKARLEALDNVDFKKEVQKIFSEATFQAKYQIFGPTVSEKEYQNYRNVRRKLLKKNKNRIKKSKK